MPEPPSGEGWIHEIKHDGYHTLLIIDGGKVRASRWGRDWTGPNCRVVEAAAKLRCKAALAEAGDQGRAQYFKAKGTLRHATIKQLLIE